MPPSTIEQEAEPEIDGLSYVEVFLRLLHPGLRGYAPLLDRARKNLTSKASSFLTPSHRCSIPATSGVLGAVVSRAGDI